MLNPSSGQTVWLHPTNGFARSDTTTPPEQFLFYHPTNMSDTTPIQPGQATILKSTTTGQFCRMAALPAGSGSGLEGMICDVPSASGGVAAMVYTGSGLSYQGRQLSAQGPGQPLSLQSSAGPGASLNFLPPVYQGQLLFEAVSSLLGLITLFGLAFHFSSSHRYMLPAGPPLPANAPINVVASGSGEFVRSDSTAAAAYLGNGDGERACPARINARRAPPYLP